MKTRQIIITTIFATLALNTYGAQPDSKLPSILDGFKDVKVLEVEVDYDDDKPVYEIDYIDGKTLSEVKVSALTGRILEKDTKYFSVFENHSYIDNYSVSILDVIKKFKLTNPAMTILEVEADDKDVIYEVKAKDNINVHKFYIDGKTGKVLMNDVVGRVGNDDDDDDRD